MSLISKEAFENKTAKKSAEAIEKQKNCLKEYSDFMGKAYSLASSGKITKEEYSKMVTEEGDKNQEKINQANAEFHEFCERQRDALDRLTELSHYANKAAYTVALLIYAEGIYVDRRDPKEWYSKFYNTKIFRDKWIPIANKDTVDDDGNYPVEKTDAWVWEKISVDGNETAKEYAKEVKKQKKLIFEDAEFDPKNPKNAILKEFESFGGVKGTIKEVQKEAMELIKAAEKLQRQKWVR